jgi:hypothetical protein
MRLRLLCLASLLVLSAASALAQTFEPGLVVRANGDTLRGEVENGFWVMPPTFIHFRPTPASPAVLFQPRQLQAVSFTNGRYFRYEGLRLDQTAETRFNDLPRGNYVVMRVDSMLAEVLLTGPVELRRVVRPGAVQYVIQRAGQPALSLSERRYLREGSNGAWQVADGNNYRSQLALYFGDCPVASRAAQTAPFTAEGLVAIAQAYATNCAASQPPLRNWLAPAQLRRRMAFQAGVLGGVRYHRLESGVYELAGEPTDGRLHPFGGLYAELLQPSRTTALYGELTLSTFSNRGIMGTYDPSTANTLYVPFDYQGVLGTARIGLRYLMPLAQGQQFVFGLGFERNVVWGLTSLAATNTFQTTPTRADRAARIYADPILLPNVTLGWRRQRFTATLDGQLYVSSDNGSGPGSLFWGNNVAARLGLSYRLGRHPDDARPASPR